MNHNRARKTTSDRTGVLFAAWFLFCAALGIAWCAFCVWAIYSVVTWITAQ